MRNLLLIFAALVVSACAADGSSTIAEREQRQVTTGSNIPKRDRGDVRVMTREELERGDARGGASAAAAMEREMSGKPPR